MEHKIVSRINCGAFRYQAWPTVAKSRDGTLFVGCSGHRLGHIDPFGKAILYVSRDEGKTWSRDTLISPEAPDWDHGYPSTVELAGGDLFTVYYMKCPGDDYNSIHSVRWNLNELK